MKKWTTALLGVILTISITACGNDKAEDTANAAEPTAAASTATSSTAPAEEANKGVPSLEELIQKTTEASDKLKSFAMDAQISQDIDVKQGETPTTQKVDMKMKSEYTKDPMQMHQVIEMTMPGEGEHTVEQYVTDKGIYSLIDGQWTKMPDEMTAQFKAAMEQSASPEKQLEQFKSIAKDTKVTEDGDDYVLTAEVSGESVKELAKSYMSQAGGSEADMGAMLDQMDIKSMTIVYAVNKESYLPTKSNVDMVMDMTAEDMSMSIDMTMESSISKHNEIEIKVPDEALNAQEMQIPAAQ